MRNKTICIAIATLLLVCTTIVAVNAENPPIGQPNFADVYGYSSLTENIPNYDKTLSQEFFSGCLAYAYFHMQEYNWKITGPFDALFMKSSSAGYERVTNSANLRKHFLMMTTWKAAGTEGSATMGVQIYFAYTHTGVGTYVQVDAIPEDWGVRGATFGVRSDANICGVEVWTVRMSNEEALLFGLGSPRATFNFTTASASQTITLGTSEQIVYASASVGNGWSDMYEYGYRIEPYVDPPIGARNWINAYKAFNGESVGGGGFTQDDLDNAYDDGYMHGEQIGYHQGAQDGHASGYEHGYDTGYDEGYDYGYNLGKGAGPTKIDIGEIITAVPEGAKSIINGALGFEIFGINVAGTLTALLVVAIVAFLVKKLMPR